MRWLRRRASSGCSGGGRKTTLREEMETHRALREDALAREATRTRPSRAGARSAIVALAQDDARDVWIWPWLDGVVRDARYTLRSLAGRPAFAVTCIATIAIGTGALASVLSVVNVVLLSPPPYPNHARIVQIGQVVERPRPGRSLRR